MIQTLSKELTLTNYKNLFDLYITDSTCDGAELSAKTADDSRNEFVNGEAVFYQNGTWEYAELSKTYSDDEMAMIPIYFGVDDEERRTCNRYRKLLVCKQKCI